MKLDLTTTYKYLMEMINDKTNLKDQIAQLERKLEAAYKKYWPLQATATLGTHRWEQYGSWSPQAWYQSSPTEEKLENLPKQRRKN